MNAAPEIPLDIRELLHDCILAVFWPKTKIIEFLKSVGCADRHLQHIDSKNTTMSRHQIVVDAFSRLAAQPDRGYAVFQTMIDRLSNWSHFDSYWFDQMAKLDRLDAENKIKRLSDAIANRNAKTERRRNSSKTAETKREKGQDLSALKSAFGKMFGSDLTPQARGKLFERFLQELFSRQSIKMGDPFSINGEQIDGSFKFEGENYIVEAKWQDPSTSTGDLYKFAYKVDGKMHGRGVFISVNGFSNQSLEAVVHGKHIKTILIDGGDLSHVLDDRISLEAMLDYKVRAAQTRGEIHVCAIRQVSKV